MPLGVQINKTGTRYSHHAELDNGLPSAQKDRKPNNPRWAEQTSLWRMTISPPGHNRKGLLKRTHTAKCTNTRWWGAAHPQLPRSKKPQAPSNQDKRPYKPSGNCQDLPHHPHNITRFCSRDSTHPHSLMHPYIHTIIMHIYKCMTKLAIQLA